VDESVREDVALLKAWPFLGKNTKVLGYNLDVKTGLLTEVKEKDEQSSESL
jgi:carbonic anhydrase